jgi:hypothetical protein
LAIALAFMTCQIKYVAVVLLTIGVALGYALFFFLLFKIDENILIEDLASVVAFC